MRGRPPKPPELRQRRNKAPSAATLPSAAAMAGAKVPPLPGRERKSERWHPEVLAWWATVWRSPMASVFVGPDIRGGLYALAELYQRRWACDDTSELVKLVAEIRQQESRFGLSPYDRHRLQWVIETGEQAAERTKRRHNLPDGTKDPRELLKKVV